MERKHSTSHNQNNTKLVELSVYSNRKIYLNQDISGIISDSFANLKISSLIIFLLAFMKIS